jgi:hypothetical protein
MRSVMDDLAAGKTVPPLKLTPKTYLSLNSNLRKKLADNIMVLNQQCVPVQVVDGQIPIRAIVPYEYLLYSLFSALSAEDDVAVNIIFSSFQAAPRSTQEIFHLIRELDWPTVQLARAINLGVLPYPEKLSGKCNKQLTAVSQVELYQRLGGQSYDKDYIFSQHGVILFYATKTLTHHYYSRQKRSKNAYTYFNTDAYHSEGCNRTPVSGIENALISMGIKVLFGERKGAATNFFNGNPAPKVNTDG